VSPKRREADDQLTTSGKRVANRIRTSCDASPQQFRQKGAVQNCHVEGVEWVGWIIRRSRQFASVDHLNMNQSRLVLERKSKSVVETTAMLPHWFICIREH
jgi:hypothetical protein